MSYKGWSVLLELSKSVLLDEIELVVIGQDSNVTNDYSIEIAELAQAKQKRFCYRKEFNELLVQKSTYALAISWRWILSLQKLKLLVIHDSLLPKYRGFAPLVNQLIDKEEIIGATLLKATDRYDEGPVIAQESIRISYPIKIETAIQLVSSCYSKLVVFLVDALKKEKQLKLLEQDHSQATYSLWRDEKDYFINWEWSSEKICRFIDALGRPYQGAQTYLNNKRIIIEEAQVIPDVEIVNRDVGKLLFFEENNPVFVCGKGLLKIQHAYYFENKQSIFPLKKFRSRCE